MIRPRMTTYVVQIPTFAAPTDVRCVVSEHDNDREMVFWTDSGQGVISIAASRDLALSANTSVALTSGVSYTKLIPRGTELWARAVGISPLYIMLSDLLDARL